ncbi:hypothetical protein HOLleu_43271 [Holothuria leucospilota]|uniref:Uncharacterized protein n=1 Tax=Holothuria leucospilota TaxID=206669 RepID=A0A9Q0Y9N1_HOLLE|nr:hypothetical protein HOLleu_43271 [Holothuria leucospilota]
MRYIILALQYVTLSLQSNNKRSETCSPTMKVQSFFVCEGRGRMEPLRVMHLVLVLNQGGKTN